MSFNFTLWRRCAVMSTPFWKKEISETKMKFVDENKMNRREQLLAKMKLRSVGLCGSGAEA
jgi:hypothetical protein